jgi:hypothetical protein
MRSEVEAYDRAILPGLSPKLLSEFTLYLILFGIGKLRGISTHQKLLEKFISVPIGPL